MVQSTVHLRPGLARALAFALSACSLSYQQILVFGLADVSGDFVLSQSLGLGAFLLGMGAGTWRMRSADAATLNRFIRLEISLAIFGFVAVFCLYAGEMLLRYFFHFYSAGQLVFALTPLALVAGFWTGQEIPILMHLSPGNSRADILGWSYFGGLLAMTALPLLLLPLLDLPLAVFSVALINFCIAAGLSWKYSGRCAVTLLLLALAILLIPWLKFTPAWRDFHLKYIYFPVGFNDRGGIASDFTRFGEIDAPLRRRSAYQWIDVVPAGASGLRGLGNDFTLFLDRRVQLSAGSQRRYHEGMVEGAVNLMARVPRKVLILGGGDGLLLPILLKHSELESVDLVELDPAVLDLARQNHELIRLNENSFADPRVQVHAQDAFKFLREAKAKFDLILIDFPLPTTYELSLLYSREFYSFVKARMENDGLALFDFTRPDDSLRGLSVLVHTLDAAGFARPFAFGQEDLFLALSNGDRALNFDYARAGREASDQTLLAYASKRKDLERARAIPMPVNSLFFPHRFQFSFDHFRDEEFPYADNPGLLEVILRRYSVFHDREFFNLSAALPPALKSALDKEFTAPRDFRQPLSNDWTWPRLQWEHTFRGVHEGPTVFHWFDLERPAELRAKIRKILDVPDGDWCGFSFDAANGAIVRYTKISVQDPGFENFGFRGSDGSETRFARSPDRAEIRMNGKTTGIRYFSARSVNPAIGSAQDRTLARMVSQFIMPPSSYILSSPTEIRSLFYP